MRNSRYICDRCHAAYDKNTIKDEENIAVGVGMLKIGGYVTRYDLCDDCLRDFNKFMKDYSRDNED